MEPIRVLAIPKGAFNKNRRISDLIKAQVEHFQHVEAKMPAGQRTTVPSKRIISEADAAAYIGSMTRILLGIAKPQAPQIIGKRKTPKPAGGLVEKIAASSAKKQHKPVTKTVKARRKSTVKK